MKRKQEASIVIPMYNAEKLIIETLDALKKQTFKHFEVIVVDDGSTDNSFNLVKKYRANFSLRVIKQKNSGPATARNNGVKHAKTNIIIFIDSDCVPHPDFVEKILIPMKNKEVFGVQGEYETKNKKFLISRYIGYEIYYRHEKMKNRNIDHIATYACAYRKEALGKGFLNIFKKADMEDTELSYRLAKENKKLVFQEDVIVKHPHPSSFSRFIKQQYTRGYWRALGHLKHPSKLVKDSYMGMSMAVQGSLSLAFFIMLIFYIISIFLSGLTRLIFLPLLFLALIYLSNVPFGIYCLRYEKKMLFLAPLLASIRSIVGTIGFLKGIICFKMFKK